MPPPQQLNTTKEERGTDNEEKSTKKEEKSPRKEEKSPRKEEKSTKREEKSSDNEEKSPKKEEISPKKEEKGPKKDEKRTKKEEKEMANRPKDKNRRRKKGSEEGDVNRKKGARPTKNASYDSFLHISVTSLEYFDLADFDVKEPEPIVEHVPVVEKEPELKRDDSSEFCNSEGPNPNDRVKPDWVKRSPSPAESSDSDEYKQPKEAPRSRGGTGEPPRGRTTEGDRSPQKDGKWYKKKKSKSKF